MRGKNKAKLPKLRAVKLKNVLTAELVSGILLGEELIEGVPFLLVNVNNRHLKLAKSAFVVLRG